MSQQLPKVGMTRKQLAYATKWLKQREMKFKKSRRKNPRVDLIRKRALQEDVYGIDDETTEETES